MRRHTLVGCLAVLLCGMVVKADIRPGADPAPVRVIWADNFDSYNQWAYDNRNNPDYQPNGTLWQGGPVPPGSPSGLYPVIVGGPPAYGCGSVIQTFPGTHELARAQWLKEMQCNGILTPAGFGASDGAFEANFDPNCGLSGEFVTSRGEFATAAYTWGTGGSFETMQLFKHSFKDRIVARDPTKNAVNGTDANPLILVFFLGENAKLSPFKNNAYIELSLDGEHAPTDYVWRGDPDRNYPDPDGCPQGPYPIVCQQARETNGSGSEDGSDLAWVNANCPPLSTKTWKSIAFGFMAIMDKDPCGILEQGSDPHVPSVDHPAVFDGNQWRQFRSGRFAGLQPGYNTIAPNPPWWFDPNMHVGAAGASTDFPYSNGGTYQVTMKITTDWILIYMKRYGAVGVPGGDTPEDNHAAVPRVYKGPFNMISFGVGPGCELDPATGECKVNGTPTRCLTYSRVSNGYNRTRVDTISLYDGELVYSTTDGACCLPNGTCSVQDELACETAGGTFGGQSTACNSLRCCPHDPFVWADRDADGDVDPDDFGGFQICYSGPGGGVSGTCKCFNRDNDNDVDVDDLTAFTNCVTGANVPYGPGFPAACVP